MNPSINLWRILTMGLLCVTLLVLFPFVFGFNFSGLNDLFSNSSFLPTLQTTLVNAIISAIVLVVFGFTGALLLLKVPSFSYIGKNLGLLIIPITLGNISIAFICKLIWGDSSFFSGIAQGGQFNKLVFLLLLELYQFGLLFVYLFWMQLQNINADRLNFAIATKFSFYQKLKDIYLPHTRNLWLLLAAIAFVFAFYEESKIAYLFKVSQGTNSELITNWLTRNYQTNLMVNPNFARSQVYDASAFVLFSAIAGLILLFLVLYYFIKKSTALKLYPTNQSTRNGSFTLKKTGLLFGLILCTVAILPLLLSLTKVSFNFNFSQLGFPLLMTFIATLASSATAIFFGIASRLGWKQTLSSFSQNSLPFFVLLFVLLLVPPIVILITGYKWMSLVGYSSQSIIYTIWIVGHILLTLPVLGSFVLFNHFRVSNNEIDYLQVYKLSKTETIRYSFFKRFKAEYLLLFIIGYSFIWNEAVLNSLFSDYIPSFVSGMKMLITGRGADYDKAFGYLLVSFIVALLSAIIWRYIIEKAQKQLNTEV
ncbi:MAG: hypothetical protein KAY50_04635 [Chitinophagaceae bacterium]|nr:hypothetical protein [Chitinophagaceae bacterium]